VTASILTSDAVQYDALFLPAGAASARTLRSSGDAIYFIEEMYKYFKSIAATGDAVDLVSSAVGTRTEPGIVIGNDSNDIASAFVQAIAVDRHWSRTGTNQVSA
jgi:catalase